MKTAYGLPKKREEVANILQAAYSEGNLDEAEYERRLEEVYAAESIEELKKNAFRLSAPDPDEAVSARPCGRGTHVATGRKPAAIGSAVLFAHADQAREGDHGRTAVRRALSWR